MNRLHPNEDTLDSKISSLIIHCINTGEKLPTEKEMMERFQVSRAQLREILNIYESNGFLVSQQGSGRYVQLPNIGNQISSNWVLLIQAKPALLLDLLEIRLMFDIAMIPKVIDKITIDQLHALSYQVSEMRRKALLKKSFAKNDREFHRIIFSSAGNYFLEQLQQGFWDLYEKSSIESYHEGLLAVAEQRQEMLNTIIHKDSKSLEALTREQYEDAQYQIIMFLINPSRPAQEKPANSQFEKQPQKLSV